MYPKTRNWPIVSWLIFTSIHHFVTYTCPPPRYLYWIQNLTSQSNVCILLFMFLKRPYDNFQSSPHTYQYKLIYCELFLFPPSSEYGGSSGRNEMVPANSWSSPSAVVTGQFWTKIFTMHDGLETGDR